MISYFLFATSALGVFTTVVDAHGYLESPRSRNYHASIVTLEGWKDVYPITTPWTEDNPSNLNQPGSTCGNNGYGRNYDHPLNIYGDPMPTVIQDCYGPEDEILLDVVLTAKHEGHFEYRACPINSAGVVATQECFDDHPLEFISDENWNMPKDDNYPVRAYIPHDPKQFTHKYKLPPGLEGDLVLIQWIYITANTCVVKGYDNYTFPANSGPIESIGDCNEYSQPEKFWNCAEVKISNDCSSSAPTPAPVDTRWYVKLTSCLNDGQHKSYDRKYDTLGECCTKELAWNYDACMNTGSVKSTGSPTSAPIPSPTVSPSKSPTKSPADPSSSPSASPSSEPTTSSPSKSPTPQPSKAPITIGPSKSPTNSPVTPEPTTTHPTTSNPSSGPSHSPSKNPTNAPITGTPTRLPTAMPSKSPSTDEPTKLPTSKFYVDWTKGIQGTNDQGKCVQDCDGDRPCGGKMETWETGYETEAVCCATMSYKTYEQCTYKIIEPQPSTPAPTPQPDTSWYPGDTNKCANDGNAPDWQHNKYLLQSQCCNSHFKWAYNNCMGIEQSASYEWYIDWTLIKCVMDCDVGDRDLCGGKVEGNWITLWSSATDCCSTQMPSYAFEECVIDHEAYQAGLQD